MNKDYDGVYRPYNHETDCCFCSAYDAEYEAFIISPDKTRFPLRVCRKCLNVIEKVNADGVVYKVVDKCTGMGADCVYNGGHGISRCGKHLCGVHVEEREFSTALLPYFDESFFTDRDEAERAAAERMKV